MLVVVACGVGDLSLLVVVADGVGLVEAEGLGLVEAEGLGLVEEGVHWQQVCSGSCSCHSCTCWPGLPGAWAQMH